MAVLARAPGFTQASTGSMKVNRYRSGPLANAGLRMVFLMCA